MEFVFRGHQLEPHVSKRSHPEGGRPPGNSHERKLVDSKQQHFTEVQRTDTHALRQSKSCKPFRSSVPVLRTSPTSPTTNPRSYDRGYFLPALRASLPFNSNFGRFRRKTAPQSKYWRRSTTTPQRSQRSGSTLSNVVPVVPSWSYFISRLLNAFRNSPTLIQRVQHSPTVRRLPN
jgi:hypothetical protein